MTDQANDVLKRLRAMAGTGGWNANIIRDAITEIERLRAAWIEAVDALATKDAAPPQPDRWETRLAVLSTSVNGNPTYGHGGQHLDGFEPFSVTTDAYSKTTVWFRRRLPT